jgi:hypothetical protein
MGAGTMQQSKASHKTNDNDDRQQTVDNSPRTGEEFHSIIGQKIG